MKRGVVVCRNITHDVTLPLVAQNRNHEQKHLEVGFQTRQTMASQVTLSYRSLTDAEEDSIRAEVLRLKKLGMKGTEWVLVATKLKLPYLSVMRFGEEQVRQAHASDGDGNSRTENALTPASAPGPSQVKTYTTATVTNEIYTKEDDGDGNQTPHSGPALHAVSALVFTPAPAPAPSQVQTSTSAAVAPNTSFPEVCPRKLPPTPFLRSTPATDFGSKIVKTETPNDKGTVTGTTQTHTLKLILSPNPNHIPNLNPIHNPNPNHKGEKRDEHADDLNLSSEHTPGAKVETSSHNNHTYEHVGDKDVVSENDGEGASSIEEKSQDAETEEHDVHSSSSDDSEIALLPIGTVLKGEFTNNEVWKNLSRHYKDKLKIAWREENSNDEDIIKLGWGKTTEFYDGKIIGTDIDFYGQRFYKCVFDLPDDDRELDINDSAMWMVLPEPNDVVHPLPDEQPKKENMIDRILVVNWHQDDDDDNKFMPVINTDLYWPWSRTDKRTYPTCNFKGKIRVVKLLKVGVPEFCSSEIEFRCGMKMTVSNAMLRKMCIEHNSIVISTNSEMVHLRNLAGLEGRLQDTRCPSQRLPTAKDVPHGKNSKGVKSATTQIYSTIKNSGKFEADSRKKRSYSDPPRDDKPREKVDATLVDDPAKKMDSEELSVVNWHQDEEDSKLFMPVVNTELYWSWSSADRGLHGQCTFRDGVRVVKLSKVGIDNNGCFAEITFRCGTLTLCIEIEALRLACREHNLIVTSKNISIIQRRQFARLEGCTPQTRRSSPRLQSSLLKAADVVNPRDDESSTQHSSNTPAHTPATPEKSASTTVRVLGSDDDNTGKVVNRGDDKSDDESDMEPRQKDGLAYVNRGDHDSDRINVKSVTPVHKNHNIHPPEYIPPRFLNYDRVSGWINALMQVTV